MSLLVVGSVALDSLETPFGRREDVLGGSASYFSTCASFFGPTRVVAVVGEDFPEEHVRFLGSRGIDLAGLVRRPGRTFRWKGRYEFDLNTAHTLDTQLNVFATFQPELPAHYRDSEYVFLGNIDPDLQRAVLDQVKGPRFVGCDTMNYWITSKRESLLRTLERVDMLFVNDAEARQLAGEHNVVKAARKILSFGPRAIVIKRGEYGALFFSGDEVFAACAVPLASVFDPTGAGDSFAGGFMGYLARCGGHDHATMRRAIVLGSVLASFTVEQFSLDRLRTLTPEEIRSRYAEARTLAHFDELEADLFNGSGTPR
ncbi:PfkB family carbohydrate kinase [Anaeromyxobacter oryzae]|uniref:Adenosine kinase n=1 Tax=Anaeromyxobacter oryzae TaxID=2918170 RepID=A0ABN6N1R7_9BACT|nr:PfkB family carbohydrate kinase [Anaeromyxobacter oryzae]BDG06490.1 adenosine kinase [Anaeromyxobacter oryzae]